MSTLCGEYSPEHGEVVLDGETASMDDPSCNHLFQNCNVAWCPQHDSLFPKLTVEEHLNFYAEIRGLEPNSESTTQHLDAIVQLLGLRPHFKKQSTQLSGGYKRRLSLGIAMIGYPTSMLVDEATTGIDPGARKLVLNALRHDAVHEEYDTPAILYSTHYLDEAEKLGTRIGIMIDGELITTGTLDRLHERYCNSYFVEIALEAGAPETNIDDDIIDAFESKGMTGTTVYESLSYHLKLQVPFADYSSAEGGGVGASSSQGDKIRQLACIFDLLESQKQKLHIKFYSVAQMNLEQIFIDLSRKQFEAEESFRAVQEQASSRRLSSRRLMR